MDKRKKTYAKLIRVSSSFFHFAISKSISSRMSIGVLHSPHRHRNAFFSLLSSIMIWYTSKHAIFLFDRDSCLDIDLWISYSSRINQTRNIALMGIRVTSQRADDWLPCSSADPLQTSSHAWSRAAGPLYLRSYIHSLVKLQQSHQVYNVGSV